MPALSQITLPPLESSDYLPNVPSLCKGLRLRLEGNVTFFVGENGSGKSTLLEGIAEKCGFNLRGGNRNHNLNIGHRFEGFESPLTRHLELTWTPRRINEGFFMRAESFFNFASYIDEIIREDTTGRMLQAYGGKLLHEQFTNFICYPGATIYQFDDDGVQKTNYEQTEHFMLTKSFLEDPKLFLRHLFNS